MIIQIDNNTYSVNGFILSENDMYEAYNFIRSRHDNEDVEYCLHNNYTQEEVEKIIASDLYYDILNEFEDNRDNSEDWINCCEAAIDYYKYNIKELLNGGD